jgi:eukaryotic-like serine/threonine-protein kinase
MPPLFRDCFCLLRQGNSVVECPDSPSYACFSLKPSLRSARRVMSDGPNQSDAPHSPLREIDRVADSFDLQWQISNEPHIREYLDKVPAELRLRLLLELVCMDFEYRVRKNLPVGLDDYFRQFPELGALPAADRAELESHARECRQALAPTIVNPSLEIPTRPDYPATIGHYKIAGRIGSGGQADIFLSFHPQFLMPVVIKLGRARQLGTTQRELITREGQILAGLDSHPNLVRVYELGLHEDRPYLVLEHIQGLTLEDFAAAERVTPRHAAELVAAVAAALDPAHRQGVIHQDITPRNVLIDGRGQPRLIDFGLSWFRPPWTDTSAGSGPTGGTPNYLSPEQADSTLGPVSARTDVFGLGAVLYFLLTGRPLYQGSSLVELRRQARETAFSADLLKKDGIPRSLAAICLKALAQNPQDRFSTTAELATALKAAIHRPRWRKVAAAALLFFCAGAGGWLLGQPARHVSGANNQSVLKVRVWRPTTGYIPLSEAAPVRTGDELQARFQVPAGLHVGLFAVDGQGRLSLLQQYVPQAAATELVWPMPGNTETLDRTTGTDMLLVCGRAEKPISELELAAIWGGAVPWKAFDSPQRLLRLKPDGVAEEGERTRGFTGTRHARPESDDVIQRLDGFRERLKSMCSLFEGLAFTHVPTSAQTKQ